jgi:putative oxidoreductase
MTSRSTEAQLNAYAPGVLSLFRAVFGFLYAIHGTIGLFAWPVGTGHDQTGPPLQVGSWPGWWASLIELVTGLLVMVGLFTRLAAFVASGNMAVAYFWQHQPHGLWPHANQGELAALYCFAFFLLVFTGGGSYALDARRRQVSLPGGRPGGWRRARRGFARRT